MRVEELVEYVHAELGSYGRVMVMLSIPDLPQATFPGLELMIRVMPRDTRDWLTDVYHLRLDLIKQSEADAVRSTARRMVEQLKAALEAR